MSDKIVERRRALIGDVQLVSVPPGEKIFDLSRKLPRLLGTVQNGRPIINGQTCYLSTDDFNRAKDALPARPKFTLN